MGPSIGFHSGLEYKTDITHKDKLKVGPSVSGQCGTDDLFFNGTANNNRKRKSPLLGDDLTVDLTDGTMKVGIKKLLVDTAINWALPPPL